MFTKLTRTAPRRWLGNGMGNDPAEYAVMDRFGDPIIRVQFCANRWGVDDLIDADSHEKFDSFREARRYALALANKQYGEAA